MRKKIIAGNWKMNCNEEETIDLIKKIDQTDFSTDVEVLISIPFTNLHVAKEILKDSKIKLSAQNMHWEEKGAYTGEISSKMLNDFGIEYVIIGHSERRQYFAETDETCNFKIKSAIKNNFISILCVGESLEQYEMKLTKNIIKNQVKNCLKGLSNEEVSNLVIAYEPIWAIGTGKVASSQTANDICEYIRNIIKEDFGIASDSVRILYGGSVNCSNAEELINMSDIDGFLVGGASLKAEEFSKIIEIV